MEKLTKEDVEIVQVALEAWKNAPKAAVIRPIGTMLGALNDFIQNPSLQADQLFAHGLDMFGKIQAQAGNEQSMRTIKSVTIHAKLLELIKEGA